MISRRNFTAAAASLAVVGTATGCVQIPKTVSATPPPRPALEQDEFAAIEKRYYDTYTKAAKKYDPKALQSIQAGVLQSTFTQQFLTLRRVKLDPDAPVKLIDPQVYPCSAGEFPRTFLTFSRTDREDEKDRMVTVNQRASSTSSWRRHVAVVTSDDAKAALDAGGELLETVPEDEKVGKRSPKGVLAAVAAAMEDPASKAGKDLESTKHWKELTKELAEERKPVEKPFNLSVPIFPQNDIVAVRVADGLLVFCAIDANTVISMDEGSTFVFSSGPYKKAYPGSYEKSSTKHRHELMVKQTDDGKLHVLGHISRLVLVEVV